MGKKYMLSAFNYPYKGCADFTKQTSWLFVAVFYLIVWSVKHFGVTLEKRG